MAAGGALPGLPLEPAPEPFDLVFQSLKPPAQLARDRAKSLVRGIRRSLDAWAVRLPIGSVARRNPARRREPVFAPALRIAPGHRFIQREGRYRGEQTRGDQADAQHAREPVRASEACPGFRSDTLVTMRPHDGAC